MENKKNDEKLTVGTVLKIGPLLGLNNKEFSELIGMSEALIPRLKSDIDKKIKDQTTLASPSLSQKCKKAFNILIDDVNFWEVLDSILSYAVKNYTLNETAKEKLRNSKLYRALLDDNSDLNTLLLLSEFFNHLKRERIKDNQDTMQSILEEKRYPLLVNLTEQLRQESLTLNDFIEDPDKTPQNVRRFANINNISSTELKKFQESVVYKDYIRREQQNVDELAKLLKKQGISLDKLKTLETQLKEKLQ